jgi:hypothetical protein
MLHAETENSATLTADVPPAREPLPEWYPSWAREMADLYFSGTTCMFALHGNVHDFVRCPGGAGSGDRYCSLTEFLSQQVFGKWDIVLPAAIRSGCTA